MYDSANQVLGNTEVTITEFTTVNIILVQD